MITKEEIINCESYWGLCDYHYTNERTEFPPGIVACDIESIPDFFAKIKNSKHKYIVVSSRSDFCLCYQREFPVWADLEKSCGLFLGTEQGYEDLHFHASCNRDRCNINDKYSIKCYCWTSCTFDEIPENVIQWFVCNNCIYNDSRIISLPFGIYWDKGAPETPDKIANYPKKERNLSLYVNFQFYTIERMRLFYYFRQFDKI